MILRNHMVVIIDPQGVSNMGSILLAWLVGEGIIIYRSVKRQKSPPGPGQLLYSSGLFVILGILAESPKARSLAVTLAWGFVIAAYMDLSVSRLPGQPPTKLQPQSGNTKHPDNGPNGGLWPPGLAPDTIVFPDGK